MHSVKPCYGYIPLKFDLASSPDQQEQEYKDMPENNKVILDAVFRVERSTQASYSPAGRYAAFPYAPCVCDAVIRVNTTAGVDQPTKVIPFYRRSINERFPRIYQQFSARPWSAADQRDDCPASEARPWEIVYAGKHCCPFPPPRVP